VLQQCENIRDWTNEEIELLEAVAAQVGIALAQARLLEQETQNRKLLQEAKNKVEVANHAKSIFLTNISHELLTPLNAILGFSQLMVQDLNLNFQQQDQLTIINRSGERLLNLIKDVLEMSKIEAGKTFLNPLPFDLHHLLYQLWQTFEPQAKLKHLLLQFNLAPDLPLYIVGDESKLRQVLTNLLSNAIKFTDAGSVIMDVESRELGIGTRILPLQVSPSPFVLRVARTPSERVSDAKVQHTNGLPVASVEENTTKWPHQQLLFAPHSLFFSIKDTGRGIAPEERENIFQPFVQAVSTNQAEGGTGLGLAISHKFVQLMGGNLQVISTVGDGSTFYFDINVTLAGSTRIKDCVGKARLLYTNDLPSDLVNNSLQIMPVQWIADLHQAAIEADGDTILRLVEQIPHAQANLAVELTQLTHLYDFDAIIELSRGKP
jgi:signal transduction histidine kinase